MEPLIHSKSELPVGDYDVHIVNEPITTPDGVTYPSKARIVFRNIKNKNTNTVEYAYREFNELLADIDKGELKLNHCYIKNFSLAEYRAVRQFPNNHPVPIKICNARESFFDCDQCIDFSFAEFSGPKVTFEQSVFGNGTVNFTGSRFAKSNVVFRRARFGGGILDFRFLEFAEGNVSFRYANFGEGNVFFVNSNFGNCNVDFQYATFGNGNVDFNYAKFGAGDLLFEKAVFGEGKKNFKAVEFGNGKVEFKRIQFNNGDISFEGAEKGVGKISFWLSSFGKGNISFDLTDFSKADVSFEKVEFGGGKVKFHEARADNISFALAQLNAYFEFKFSTCNVLDLHGAVVRDVIDFLPDRHPVEIRTMNFAGLKKLGRIIIDWRNNNALKMIYSQTETSLFQKADQFRMLKEEFNTDGKYDYEDNAYVEFKRCESKALLEHEFKTSKMKGYLYYPSYAFQWLIFDKMGRYATSPARVMTSVIVVYSLYSFLYYLLPILFDTSLISSFNMPDSHTLPVCFYYSAVTFFTIGYGDYYPVGVLRLLATLEGFSGVFLMSYFVVAFVRKILR